MKKIPTLFVRDPERRRYVTPEVTAGCEWVFAGEGVPTRKYDGTCVRIDELGNVWARREVKPGKQAPDNFVESERDFTTGKTVGWEPIEQSPFAKFLTEARKSPLGGIVDDAFAELAPLGTYELVGPRINGNPENVDRHLIVKHGYMSYDDIVAVEALKPTFEDARAWLLAHDWEGVVWHHPDDGRMAKLKRRDFPAEPRS